MRGCKIKVSLSMLLKTLGLTGYSDIGLFGVTTHGCEYDDSLYLILCSEYNTDLPEVPLGGTFPDAYIECEVVRSKIVIRK